MKLLQLIAMLLFLSSCTMVGKKNLLYGKCCSKDYLACNQIELKKDKTFDYYVFTDVGGGKIIKGQWDYKNGDTLRLNTFKQPKILKTYYEGSQNDSLKGKIKIQISDFESPLGFASIKINNGEKKGALNEEGIIYFKIDEVRDITYSYLNRIETIEISNHNFNDIKIVVKDLESEVASKYITNRLVVATNREIVMYPNTPEKKFKIKRSRFGKKHCK